MTQRADYIRTSSGLAYNGMKVCAEAWNGSSNVYNSLPLISSQVLILEVLMDRTSRYQSRRK